MASKGSRGSVAVGWPGKLKTATQMLALQILLLGTACAGGAVRNSAVMRAGLSLLYASAFLTVVSGAQLARQAVRCLGAAE
jgi:phosphatidylglycerophosphate synthase